MYIITSHYTLSRPSSGNAPWGNYVICLMCGKQAGSNKSASTEIIDWMVINTAMSKLYSLLCYFRYICTHLLGAPHTQSKHNMVTPNNEEKTTTYKIQYALLCKHFSLR